MCSYDYIIVGSGLAGLYTAYRASLYGKVALLTKSNIRESNSYFAQGGIAAVTDEHDAPSFHFQDTITAGRGLCDYPAVNILVNEGPRRIQELIDEGMHFDTENGTLALGLEGGHHQKRILHAGGDATGKMITNFVIDKVEHCQNVTVFDNHAAIDLLIDEHGCYGVRCWDFNANREEIFTGDNIFLTSGGASAIYKRTTNPHSTIGDGLALAYFAGCEIADMEFIQFHPSAIYTPTGEAYLVSEAVRGEGAHLLNQQGERFMVGKHELAELAPRDIVAQSIFEQMQKHHQEFVYLSLKHLDPQKIKRRFPNIFEKCTELGIDMTDRIPVAPAAHYTVGGVRTDVAGRTNIPHLYCCGELASSGIMGANRLASNSLIECLVFGKRAVEDSIMNKRVHPFPVVTSHFKLLPEKQNAYLELKNKIADIMTRNAGIIRTESGLRQGLDDLDEWLSAQTFEKNEYYSTVSKNLIYVAKLIIQSALYRKESRGGHFRADYPAQNDPIYACHIIQQLNREIKKSPVNLNMK
ncbi:L-aspartate oxidase [Gabonibacter massiliensis]|uniref:L-aspartate oxidase n=1 Tax=Gabonibacter massiliensis TaxID=1720195 RepID=UPI00073E5A34|nr:L-aspartate oxidase [Gabonibacter massiliensis]